MEIYFSIISSPFLLYNVDLAWKSVVHKFVDLPVEYFNIPENLGKFLYILLEKIHSKNSKVV